MKQYTIAQAAQAFDVPPSALSQAVLYGQVTTSLKTGPKGIPLHYVSQDEMQRFQALYTAPGYNAPGYIVSSSRYHPKRATAPMRPDEEALRAARDIVDDRIAARDLGMTLAEYREVAL